MIVSYKIAKKARELGFDKEVITYYDEDDEDRNYYVQHEEFNFNGNSEQISAPTYHELIDWIFELSKVIETSTVDNAVWLETWYKLLKKCPLKYEFKGRLLEWFEGYGYFISNDKVNIRYINHIDGASSESIIFNSKKRLGNKVFKKLFKSLKQVEDING